METLQRIYGISFPDPKMLKDWEKFQEEAKNRDHRKLGRVWTEMWSSCGLPKHFMSLVILELSTTGFLLTKEGYFRNVGFFSLVCKAVIWLQCCSNDPI